MYIMHVALGGCLTAPAVDYGVTEDTGGHIAYVIGAATAQASRSDVSRVEIVTRAFDAPALGAIYAEGHQIVGPKLVIRRLGTSARGYLSKEALTAELPRIEAAFLAELGARDNLPDVIHAHFADAARLGIAAQSLWGIPLVYTPHSLGIDKLLHRKGAVGPPLLARITQEREAIAAADAVVVSSRDEAERQIVAYSADPCGRVWRISPGVPRMPAPAPGLGAARALIAPYLDDAERPIILAIARPVLRKNLGTLARVFRDMPDLAARANLVILAGQHGVGRRLEREAAGVVADLERIALDPALRGRVALPPVHGPQAVAELYRLAAASRGIFVNPALHEPFGLTLLEAAHHGLPVVATREGGPADILGRIGHGTLIDPTDPRALADALTHLLADPDAWDRAAKAAAVVRRAYTWDGWARRMQDVYCLIRNSAPHGRVGAPPASPSLRQRR